MGKKYDFDYIIIGGGPAGETAALKLAAKKHVAIIDEQPLGGSNLNTRDIPYAINLDFAHTFSKFSNYPQVSNRELHFNFPTALSEQTRIISSIRQENIELLEKAKVTFIDGHAHFLNQHTVAVGQKQHTATNFILATGTELNTNGIFGLDSVNYLTPDTVLKINKLPKYLLVVGGGSTGCEIAAYFAELGTKIILVEASGRLLPREDAEASATITEYFTKKLGITVACNTRVVAIEKDLTGKKVILKIGQEEKTIRIENVVLATGSRPRLDYGLENAGVKYQATRIVVNKLFQTSAKHIYAIGDCIGNLKSSTELAEYQASLLACNLLQKTKSPTNQKGFIRLTNTYPGVATIGMSESMLKSKKKKYKSSIVYIKDIPAGKIAHLDYGFVKILANHNNRIIGATIVAPNAELMAEELSIAIRHRLPMLEIASTPHVANSFNYAIKLAALQLVRSK